MLGASRLGGQEEGNMGREGLGLGRRGERGPPPGRYPEVFRECLGATALLSTCEVPAPLPQPRRVCLQAAILAVLPNEHWT